MQWEAGLESERDRIEYLLSRFSRSCIAAGPGGEQAVLSVEGLFSASLQRIGFPKAGPRRNTKKAGFQMPAVEKTEFNNECPGEWFAFAAVLDGGEMDPDCPACTWMETGRDQPQSAGKRFQGFPTWVCGICPEPGDRQA